MCVVSNTGDYWNQRLHPWSPYIPQQIPWTINPNDKIEIKPFPIPATGPTQAEFDQLKREVEILKEQLRMAKAYDEKNNEPDCEIEGKMKVLREVAKLVGIDLEDVLKKKE